MRFVRLGGLLIRPEDLERQKAVRKAGRVTDTYGKGEVNEVVAVSSSFSTKHTLWLIVTSNRAHLPGVVLNNQREPGTQRF